VSMGASFAKAGCPLEHCKVGIAIGDLHRCLRANSVKSEEANVCLKPLLSAALSEGAYRAAHTHTPLTALLCSAKPSL
jgi:hypothetical protein